MERVIRNVPTNKLNQVFDDLQYEFPLENIWATYNGLRCWNVHYLV
jgi:hypothetical protein